MPSTYFIRLAYTRITRKGNTGKLSIMSGRCIGLRFTRTLSSFAYINNNNTRPFTGGYRLPLPLHTISVCHLFPPFQTITSKGPPFYYLQWTGQVHFVAWQPGLVLRLRNRYAIFIPAKECGSLTTSVNKQTILSVQFLQINTEQVNIYICAFIHP